MDDRKVRMDIAKKEVDAIEDQIFKLKIKLREAKRELWKRQKDFLER